MKGRIVMFGYVRPLKGELLVREFEEYKAVYCTLCRELGKHYGIFSRLALSYDLTYYTMLALDIADAKPKLRKGRCVVNPTKKCNFICEGSEAYKKGAALTVLMTYQKLRDNIADEKFFKKCGARFLMLFAKNPAKKAAADYPFMAEALDKMMTDQANVESMEAPSIDACCEPTAGAMSVIFAELAGSDDAKKLILSQLGYFLGRWVYTIDAADDLEADLKEGSFNPFVSRLKLGEDKTVPAQRRDEIDRYCNEVLNNNVAMINGAVNLLELGRYNNIIGNVSMLGMGEVQREILFLHVHSKNKRERLNKSDEI